MASAFEQITTIASDSVTGRLEVGKLIICDESSRRVPLLPRQWEIERDFTPKFSSVRWTPILVFAPIDATGTPSRQADVPTFHRSGT